MLSFFVTLQTLFTERVEASKDRGATAVEYGLMVALIAAVIVVIVATLGREITAAFQTIVTAIPGTA